LGAGQRDGGAIGGLKFKADSRAVTITGYTGKSKEVSVPEITEGLPVTIIEDSAFKNRHLTRVSLPESVTTIGDSAFRGNALSGINLPANQKERFWE
jgi:hypothetical protein